MVSQRIRKNCGRASGRFNSEPWAERRLRRRECSPLTHVAILSGTASIQQVREVVLVGPFLVLI